MRTINFRMKTGYVLSFPTDSEQSRIETMPDVFQGDALMTGKGYFVRLSEIQAIWFDEVD